MQQRYWSGNDVTKAVKTGDVENNILVFGSNPEGRHGAGLAKAAMAFGARYGRGRGLHGNTYALVTKNLTKGYIEPCTGIKYRRYGGIFIFHIMNNIRDLYLFARENPEKQFFIPYIVGEENLNGYSSPALRRMFLHNQEKVPYNVIFHTSMK